MTADSISRRVSLFLVAALVFVFLTLTVVTRNAYTLENPGANDMLPRWIATRAWLFEGLSPYAPEIEARGQELIYGRPATNLGEDLARFLYFPYAMFFFVGIAPLSYDWAQAAWMTVLELSLIAVAFISFRIHKWRPRPWLVVPLVLWVIIAYPSARSILLGQLSIVMILLVTLAWWAIKERRDVVAGVALALATAKPTIAILIGPAIFIWAFQQRRWRLIAAMSASLVGLILFSFVVAPDWVGAVLAQAADYTTYTEIGSVVNIVIHAIPPDARGAAEIGVSGMLLLWVAWCWWGARNGSADALDYAMAVTIVVTLLVSPRTGTTSQPLLYPVLFMLFAALDHNRVRFGQIYILFVLIVLFIGLWILFLITLQGRLEQPPVFLPLPIGIAGALILSRLSKRNTPAS